MSKNSGFFWVGDVRYFRPRFGVARRAAVQERGRYDAPCDPLAILPTPTIINPYYIGSVQMIGEREQERMRTSHGIPILVSPKFAKRTVEDAVKEAQRRLADDPKLTEVSIVKIVRVVRRAKPVAPAIEIEVVE